MNEIIRSGRKRRKKIKPIQGIQLFCFPSVSLVGRAPEDNSEKELYWKTHLHSGSNPRLLLHLTVKEYFYSARNFNLY